MSFRVVLRALSALTLAAGLLAAFTGAALAHERRDVGKYQLVVGFGTEPAFEGVPNGAAVRVTNRETNAPVTGLEQTLQVEIHQGDAKVEKSLRAVFGQPGFYQADFIPTAPGTYEFHFKGTVEGLEVEQEFVSGPGRFNDVQAAADLQFPVALPSVREVAGVARSASTDVTAVKDAAADAQGAADSARTMAMVGVGAGVLGIVLGAGAMALRRR